MLGLISTFTSPGPELLKLGPFTLRWYGFLIALAVLIGSNLSNYLAKKRGIEANLINDLLPFLILFSLIGARIYYVIFEWRYYKNNILSSFAIWNGGIAIHGALLAGALTVFIFCKYRKQPFLDVLDSLLPSVALGQAIGRWGNFFNNEAYGIPTNLPWKLSIPFTSRIAEFSNSEYFHPTFLYESFWNLIVFILLIFLFHRGINGFIKLGSGALSCLYLISYSIGRTYIESLRIDSLCLGGLPPYCEGGIRVAQLISIVMILIGSIGLQRIYQRETNSESKVLSRRK